MVVKKGSYGYYVIHSSNHQKIIVKMWFNDFIERLCILNNNVSKMAQLFKFQMLWALKLNLNVGQYFKEISQSVHYKLQKNIKISK